MPVHHVHRIWMLIAFGLITAAATYVPVKIANDTLMFVGIPFGVAVAALAAHMWRPAVWRLLAGAVIVAATWAAAYTAAVISLRYMKPLAAKIDDKALRDLTEFAGALGVGSVVGVVLTLLAIWLMAGGRFSIIRLVVALIVGEIAVAFSVYGFRLSTPTNDDSGGLFALFTLWQVGMFIVGFRGYPLIGHDGHDAANAGRRMRRLLDARLR